MNKNCKAALMKVLGYALVSLPIVSVFTLMSLVLIHSLGVTTLLVVLAVPAAVMGCFIGGTMLIDKARR